MFEGTRRIVSVCLAVGMAVLVGVANGSIAYAQEIMPPSLTGSWNGSWNSQTTGHQGPLSANIRPTGDGNYSATFTGKFFKVIPFRYQMKLQVVGANDGVLHLAGSKKLGPLMGYYSYNATVSGNSFSASYRTKRDSGTFFMRRR